MTDTVTPENNTDSAPKAEKVETIEPVNWEEKYKLLKDEASKWEKRAKENFEKATNWDDYTTNKKPQIEKDLADYTLTRKELADLKFSQLKAEVAQKFNLPEGALKRLNGKTVEELEADAEELSKLFGTQPENKKPAVKPNKLQGVSTKEGTTEGFIKTKEDLENYLKQQ